MDSLENARLDHQRNKSDIVNTVKHMFASNKWGDKEYKDALEKLIKKDEQLIKEVTRIIKEKRSTTHT